MMANIISKSNRILLGAIGLLLACACGNDGEPQLSTPDPDEGREKSVVDITLSLGEAWDIDYDGTRAAPTSNSTVDNTNSYMEIQDIDSVYVYTFRRKEGTGTTDTDLFYKDSDNCKTLGVSKKEDGDHKHSIAEGTITKTYGYEYRVVAIAYPREISKEYPFPKESITGYSEKASDWISITSDTYNGFCAKLDSLSCGGWDDYLNLSNMNKDVNTKHIHKKILQTPQVFYGTLHSKNNESNIISYADVDSEGNMSSTVGLTGILRRGVAKVELKFEDLKMTDNDKDGIEWITVLAATPNTKVELKSYEDFLSCSEPLVHTYATGTINKVIQDKYTAVAYLSVEKATKDKSVSFYILPGKTKLAIRAKTSETAIGMQSKHLRNGQLTGAGAELHGNNGTGIVSPDFIENEFYFRRNHKYTITVNSARTILTGSSSLD